MDEHRTPRKSRLTRYYAAWLRDLIADQEPYGMSELVLSGFLRVVTHPRVFKHPTPLETALDFAELLRSQPNCVVVAPGQRHWDIFIGLCRTAGAKGNLVPDAYLSTGRGRQHLTGGVGPRALGSSATRAAASGARRFAHLVRALPRALSRLHHRSSACVSR
jgi:predicted nucleic acid-binding protein